MNKMMNMYTYMGPDSQAKKRKLTKLTSLNPGIYNLSLFFITGVLVSKAGKNEISTLNNALRLKCQPSPANQVDFLTFPACF